MKGIFMSLTKGNILKIVIILLITVSIIVIYLRFGNQPSTGITQKTDNQELIVESKSAELSVDLAAELVEEVPSECLVKETARLREKCLFPYFEKVTLNQSAEFAMKKNKELKAQGVIDDCHLISHEIGHANYEKHKNNVGEAFISCSLGCLEGCFHGVIESYVGNSASPQSVIKKVPELCSSLGADQEKRTICIHGVGHGMLKHNLEQLKPIADLCRTLPSTADDIACLTGVFMENMNAYLSLREDELRSVMSNICKPILGGVEESDYAMCSEKIGEGLVTYFNNDREKAKLFCEGLPEGPKEECVRGAENLIQAM